MAVGPTQAAILWALGTLSWKNGQGVNLIIALHLMAGLKVY